MATFQDNVIEARENIPLKNTQKSTNWWKCCGKSDDYFNEAKFLNTAFGSLTVIITIALLLQIYYGDYQVVPHGSVATDSVRCSGIGTEILKKGGNAIDATIASAFCLSVIAPHLTSLDAGGELLIYNHRERTLPILIDFNIDDVSKLNLPRLVVGLGYIHQYYGSLSWKTLVQPSVNLARQGFLITKFLTEAIKQAQTEDLYGHLEAGQMLILKTLSDTLEKIANLSEQDLYDLINIGQLPKHSNSLKGHFYNYDIYIPDHPLIGPLLLTNLEKIEIANFTQTDLKQTEYISQLINITQETYNIGNLTQYYHEGVSTNIAVMDMNDNYVSFITGLYGLFGSGELTTDGYILNKRNRKQPTRLPLIITDRTIICGRRLIFGATNLDIATQLIMQLLIGKENLINSIEAPRFHLSKNGNNSIGIEKLHTPLFSDDSLKYLKTFLLSEPYSSSNIVEKIKDDLNSHSDSRGGGLASRF